MIYCVTAPPRTGKTLYVVHVLLNELSKKHYNKEGKEILPPYIIHNIDGFEKGSLVLPETGEGIQRFIVERDWGTWSKEHPDQETILVIDEAQRVFGTTGMPRDIQAELLFFLEYHGHFGLKVFLITQSSKSLHSRVYPLISNLVEISKIRSFSGGTRVKIKCPVSYEITDTLEFKPTEREFSAYKSAHTNFGLQTNATPLARLVKQFGIYILVLVLSLSFMGYYIYDWVSTDKKDTIQSLKDSENKNSNPAPVSNPVIQSAQNKQIAPLSGEIKSNEPVNGLMQSPNYVYLAASLWDEAVYSLEYSDDSIQIKSSELYLYDISTFARNGKVFLNIHGSEYMVYPKPLKKYNEPSQIASSLPNPVTGSVLSGLPGEGVQSVLSSARQTDK